METNIISISSDGSTVYGLGEDGRIYSWRAGNGTWQFYGPTMQPKQQAEFIPHRAQPRPNPGM